MNKISKILSVVLAAVVALSITVVMLVSASAATAPTFSLNVVEGSETDKTVDVSVNLKDGKFANLDIVLKVNDKKISGCTKIVLGSALKEFKNELEDAGNGTFNFDSYVATLRFSGACATDCEKAGPMVVYSLTKATAGNITKDDVQLVVEVCGTNADKDLVATVESNLPDAPTAAPTDAPTVAPTDAPTDAPTVAPTDAPTVAPTDAPTVAPTDAPTVAPTDAPTVAPTDAPTVAPTDAPTVAPTDAPTVAPTVAPTDAPTTVAPTTTKVLEPTTIAPVTTTVVDPTTVAGSAATGTVTNPNTGDHVTVTAAILSLLAVSGAAVVALRKKED